MVVLDPAHGGEDSGALLKSGQAEKTLALAFAYRLRSMLGARGMQVVFTRENDGTVGPDQRAETANRAQAQACLSVHFTETGTGVHLFAYDLSQSSSGQRFVPWKTAQSTWINRSLALTGRVNSTLQQAGVNVTLARIALPGLDSMACPALAIEIAPEQSGQNAALDDPKYQARLAGALSAALLAWRSEQHP